MNPILENPHQFLMFSLTLAAMDSTHYFPSQCQSVMLSIFSPICFVFVCFSFILSLSHSFFWGFIVCVCVYGIILRVTFNAHCVYMFSTEYSRTNKERKQSVSGGDDGVCIYVYIKVITNSIFVASMKKVVRIDSLNNRQTKRINKFFTVAVLRCSKVSGVCV